MRSTQNGKTFIREFDNWAEWLSVASQHPPLGVKANSHEQSAYRTEYTATQSFEEVVALATHGWPEGRERMKAMADRIKRVICSKIVRPLPRISDSGDEVDVPVYLTGDPEHWVEYPITECKAVGGRIVSLCLDIAMSAGCKRILFEHRGSAMLAIVDALEDAGYRCEIEFRYSCENEKSNLLRYLMTVPFKQADEPVEVDRLAFVLAHPSTPRRLAFSVLEGDKMVSKFHPDLIQKAEIKFSHSADFFFDRLYLGDNNSAWLTPESATAEVLRLLKASNLVEIEPETVSA